MHKTESTKAMSELNLTSQHTQASGSQADTARDTFVSTERSNAYLIKPSNDIETQKDLEKPLKIAKKEEKSDKCQSRGLTILILILILLVCAIGLYVWMLEQKVLRLQSQALISKQNNWDQQTDFEDIDVIQESEKYLEEQSEFGLED